MYMKSILLVSDVDNWAWHYKACELRDNLCHLYKIDVVYTHAEPNYKNCNLVDYDHIHIFGWYSIGEREKLFLHKISTSIASIEYEILKPEKAKVILPLLKIVAVSEVLFDHLKFKGYNVFACYNGVNELKFTPNHVEHNKFRVGLACKPPSKYDLHGYSIAEKIQLKLQKYDDVEFVMHIANHKTAISHEEMSNLYNTLDVFIHTGRYHLATPNPVFEASATGIPIIGTTNGCIPLLIKNNVNGFLIDINISDDDKVDQFVEKILYLKNNPDICKIMGLENRKIITSDWTWKKRALDWQSIFN